AVAAAVALLAVMPILRQPKTSKYADLAEAVVVDRADLIRTLSQPDLFRPVLEASLASYQSGDYTQAEAKAREILAAIPTDPSALFVMALAEHKRGNLGAAFQLMSQSERIEPKTEYRCWTALQFALMSGDRILIDRECRHMDGHERYQERARQILEQVRKRQASWERPGVGLRSS
ncbi:MAG: hypothetical protein HYR60_16055, partial [Acidobacteria bacterium]|nr:hypothetical protein [Acidobacteriota bacterium]